MFVLPFGVGLLLAATSPVDPGLTDHGAAPMMANARPVSEVRQVADIRARSSIERPAKRLVARTTSGSMTVQFLALQPGSLDPAQFGD